MMKKIRFECALHRNICLSLDTICSKLRLKHGEPKLQDYTALQQEMVNPYYLWSKASNNYTAKIHAYLKHVIDQMRRFNGTGDMLEDDIKYIHQKAAKIESRKRNIKLLSISDWRPLQRSREIKEAMEPSITASKRNFKKQNLEHSAAKKKVKANIQRYNNRIVTLSHIASKPHETVHVLCL